MSPNSYNLNEYKDKHIHQGDTQDRVGYSGSNPIMPQNKLYLFVSGMYFRPSIAIDVTPFKT